MRKEESNKGFTLIEIIVSIAVLSLLMIPILNNYVSTSKVNNLSEQYQKAATLGQNLVEAVKTKSVKDMAMMFYGAETFQLLNSNLNGFSDAYQMDSYADEGYGEYNVSASTYTRIELGDADSSVKASGTPPDYEFDPPDGKGTYHFAIENIKDGETTFDAVITLSAEAYRDSSYGESMNKYKMPELQILDPNVVTILDLEGATTTWSDDTLSASYDNSNKTDNQAFSDFKNIHLSQVSYYYSLSEDDRNALGLTVPTEYTDSEIKDAMSKDIKINIYKNNTRKTIRVDCNVAYSISLAELTESASYGLYSSEYKIDTTSDFERVVYVFYTPSEFVNDEKISILNDGAKIKLVMAKQGGDTVSGLVIDKSDINYGATAIYSNIGPTEIDPAYESAIKEHNLISRAASVDRIYDISVSIYEGGAIASGTISEPFVTLTSTREE